MLTLTEVKRHVVVDDDDDLHDEYLQLLIEAAIAAFNQYTERELVEQPANDKQVALSADIKIGLLLMIGHWFANRESVVVGTISNELPFTTQFLWQPYCRLVLG
ncbi:head-tail connector protein [Zooshikella ganghwensis]|uniref:Phage gp6-like head-tail connector protein n=1 Tax=Zooshikella ganghwensis TaxID=202772 RepID=A0A4P9VHA7_9GAMM|nr:head-tail connector protein [Zooshikella ganghwensis]RDH41600.1 phage gp6-like head-tail connector protein [Zooshikella ganghwensis]RDH41667.1 phage gp6-like head-tail connector protein [Zooshikella ganghwensis]RDH41690.1 phage gp6-like head-tail connector protein [Zooshikella ganghwensis]RDH41747.1 phage gp6-like head-tail connector protein [Zooshikella ganghwensis]